jgi:hypothetical protein
MDGFLGSQILAVQSAKLELARDLDIIVLSHSLC